jgi:hypothetical protein
LNVKAIEYGEAMAITDHRGCLSNQISWLLIEEWKKRQAEVPPAPVNGKESEVAA